MDVLATKKRIIDKIIMNEGGYVNDPSDSGGPTRYGITEATARAYGYAGSMRQLPLAVAEKIYSDRYWMSINGDRIAEVSCMIAEEVADTAVNMGSRRAVTFLQRSLNALNLNSALYDNLVVDGLCGSKTVNALAAYTDVRDVKTLHKALNCLQGSYYIELVERREKDKKFIYGWLRNRVS